MKKLFLLSVLMLLPMLASADAVEIDGIYYNLIEKAGQAEVTQNPNNYTGTVVIPESVVYAGKNYNVTSIGNYAFCGCSNLTSVTISNSVTFIGDGAFMGCYGLTSVIIPNSVTSIGLRAFSNCIGLTSVIIPNSVTSIGEEAFDSCDGLTSVTIDNSVTSIGRSAFSSCIGLTSVIIPNSVTSIGEQAFRDCSGLTSVNIGNSVTSIGSEAFHRCSRLTSVTIGKSVASIGKDAFDYCFGLTSVHITDITAWCNIIFNDNPLRYAHHLYLNGEEIKDLVIPNSVTSIGNDAFYGCSGMTSVTIPNSVTSIGYFAFSHCSSLTSITIPNSVTSIGYATFSYCSGLTSIKVEGDNPRYDSRNNCNAIIETSSNTLIAGCKNTIIPNSVTSIGYAAFYSCDGLTSVTIPNSVTSIGEWAFGYCWDMTSVTIPNSVTSIGGYAFIRCEGLTSVISLIENPFIITGKISDYRTFDLDVFNNVTLYVPVGTIDKYKATEGWKDFLFIEEGTGPNGGDGETPETKKCATPTINYQFGQLSFSCETEGVTFVSEITDYDIKKSYDASLYLTATYYISVYATKDGYNNSDVATATLSWMDAELFTDDISGGAATVRAKAVLIQSNGSMLSIAGADEGTAISVYDMSGKMVGSATAAPDITNISTSLRPGDIALVKIGEKTIKLLIK